jgi:hypothetical protein
VSFHIDLDDVIRQLGLTPLGKALMTGGKLVLRQNVSYKHCEIKVVFVVTFEHQNIITSAEYMIEDIVYSYIEELSIPEFERILNEKLRECCNNLVGSQLEQE